MLSLQFKKDGFMSVLPKIIKHIQTLKDDVTYCVEIKVFRKRRSLDANAYLWTLVSKMADVLRTDKDSVYLTLLKRYGQTGILKVPNHEVERFKRFWKYCEKHETLPDEDKAQYYRFWAGSSLYNTEEMAILIDGVISECKSLGIETKTPDELAKMKALWGKEDEKQAS